MSCFLYLADTHVGAEHGFQQQPRDPARLGDLLARLREWIDGHGPVHGILHGGDLLDQAEPEFLDQALELFAPAPPLYLCVGNHDLTDPDAASMWRRRGQAFLGGGDELCYTIRRPDCRIHIVPNHWDEHEWLWDERQDPRFSAAQWRWLEHELAMFPDLPHVLVTHCPAVGIPIAQTGLPTTLHPVPEAFSNRLLRLSEDFPQLRLVLGAHNHANTHFPFGHCHFVTVSSFIETPFEFKVIEIDRDRLTLSTHSLWNRVDWPCGYDWDRAYIQGRVCDRAFHAIAREPDDA